MPPPAGVQSPMLWGTEAHLRELFGDGVASLEVTERTFTFRFRSAEEFVDVLPPLVRPDAEGVRGARRRPPATRSSPTSSSSPGRYDRLGGDAVAIPATYTEAVAINASAEHGARHSTVHTMATMDTPTTHAAESNAVERLSLVLALGASAASPAQPAYSSVGDGSRTGTLTVTGDGGRQQARPPAQRRPDARSSTSATTARPTSSSTAATFTAIDVGAGGGDDTVRVDQSGGLFTDEAVTLNGGAGDDTLIGGDGADS